LPRRTTALLEELVATD
jgi:hypothetical protein